MSNFEEAVLRLCDEMCIRLQDDCEADLLDLAYSIVDWHKAQLAKQEPIEAVRVEDMVEAQHHAFGSGLFASSSSVTTLYAAPIPAQAPEWWKLVPVEPTLEIQKVLVCWVGDDWPKLYRAMLAAAPFPPQANDAKDAALKMAGDALERLSCLGNGDMPGNSIGNVIAQEAIAAIEAAMKGQS